MDNFASRLEYYIDNQLNMSIIEFEKKLELPNGAIHRAINGTNIGVDKIILIAQKCPELNIDWLLTGEGAMTEKESSLNGETDIMMEPTVKYHSINAVLEKLAKSLELQAESSKINAEANKASAEANKASAEAHKANAEALKANAESINNQSDTLKTISESNQKLVEILQKK